MLYIEVYGRTVRKSSLFRRFFPQTDLRKNRLDATSGLGGTGYHLHAPCSLSVSLVLLDTLDEAYNSENEYPQDCMCLLQQRPS